MKTLKYTLLMLTNEIQQGTALYNNSYVAHNFHTPFRAYIKYNLHFHYFSGYIVNTKRIYKSHFRYG
jgi:hypothetical protein